MEAAILRLSTGYCTPAYFCQRSQDLFGFSTIRVGFLKVVAPDP